MSLKDYGKLNVYDMWSIYKYCWL